MTLVSGLIHGSGLAADPPSEPIPPGRLLELLAGFDIGMEIGQLARPEGATQERRLRRQHVETGAKPGCPVQGGV